jgi:hypothetical protein
MSPSDLATLSLLDPDQGVCPDGHACDFGDTIGERVCDRGEYRGLALIWWDISSEGIDGAARIGAAANVIDWARAFLADRG